MSLVNDLSGKRRIRAGMVGGGEGAFFAGVHRAAIRLTDRFEIVAGAFSSVPQNCRKTAAALAIAPDRAYLSFADMAKTEAGRDNGVEVVIIVTPNHLHFEPCKLFLELGMPVICDKPLVNSAGEARELQRIAAKDDTFFALTYTYTGYPMVRDARARVCAGEIGDIKFMYVEYLLDWLAGDPSKLGKSSVWRGDPAKAGPTGALGDVGTHAFNILEFVSGRRCTALSANLVNTVEDFGLDDTTIVQMEFDSGANGLLWCSLATPGHRNGLRFKIVGTTGTLEWEQEKPEMLRLSRLSQADLIYRRGLSDNTADAAASTSLPAGNPEAYFEALANLYTDYAAALEAGPDWRTATRVPIPDLHEGLRGVLLSDISVESSRRRAWLPFSESQSG